MKVRLARRLGFSVLASAALPAALLIYLSFNAGGLFVDTTALAAAVLAGVLLLRVLVARDPLGGMSLPLGVAAGMLCLYAAWCLISASWSHAPGRALIEFDRTLLYLFALVLFGSFPRTSTRTRWVVRGLAFGVTVVCLAGFVSRTVPELWSVDPSPVAPDRLSFPLTYWNALGAMATLGFIVCFYLCTSTREPPVARVLGAAALPLIAATLLLTFSRGAIGACLVGLVLYVVIARPHALLGGLVAVVPSVAVAVSASYRADDVALGEMTTKAVGQGHDLALVVLVGTIVAAVLRVLALRIDAFETVGDKTHALVPRVAVVLVAGVLVVGAVAGGANFVERQYDRFVSDEVDDRGGIRNRLDQLGNNGRISHWDVAVKAYRQEKLHGHGAGTYQVLWSRYRPTTFTTTEGHSLYLETLGELGLVGLVVLVGALGSLLVGLAARVRGRDRAVYAALFGAMVAWALQSGIDWLWEMPAVTVWVFVAGGAALAAAPRESGGPGRGARSTRVVVAVAILLLGVTPVLLGISQRHLNNSVRSFKGGDCSAAVEAALDSISAVGSRPEPYEILGYCNARMGSGRLAVRAFDRAISRDPRNWELHYGLAIARASSGRDPRAAALTALRLNPLSALAENGVRRFDTDSPAAWRRRSRTAQLPIP